MNWWLFIDPPSRFVAAVNLKARNYMDVVLKVTFVCSLYIVVQMSNCKDLPICMQNKRVLHYIT